jgi:hypothetical protein
MASKKTHKTQADVPLQDISNVPQVYNEFTESPVNKPKSKSLKKKLKDFFKKKLCPGKSQNL